MTTDKSIYIHPAALVETADVGPGTRIWAFAHVQQDAAIGANCNVGDHCFVETGAVIGDNVTLKNNVSVWEGVHISDGAFIGPNVAFTNDRFPRSPRLAAAALRYATKDRWLAVTRVEHGATIGANATILPGRRIGRFAMVGAGAVVTADVPPFTLVTGTPARPCGLVCRCGQPLVGAPPDMPVVTCPSCQATFDLSKVP